MMMAAPKTPPISQAGTAPEAGGIVLSAPLCRECSGYNTREGKKLAPSCEAFSAPGARAVRGHGLESRSGNPINDLPLSGPTPPPARGGAPADAREDRDRTCHRAIGRKVSAPTS